MKSFFQFLFLVFAVFFAFFSETISAQNLQIDSLSRVNYQQTHDTKVNDIWGYTDELGNEYALVGARKGTSIVKITPPTNPVEVGWFPDSVSIWRDLSTWGDYAYVTTEAKAGLFIINMSGLPNSTVFDTAYFKGSPGSRFTSAHTLFIDDEGFAYIFGANRGEGGVIILDVHTDPMNPIEVGFIDNWYVHDGHARNDTLYCANIYEGFMSIWNIADKTNPILLNTVPTPNGFTHNAWPTDDGKVVFTTDETADSYLTAYDVSNPANPIELDRIQDLPGSGTVIHNVHIRGDYAISSYYSSGIVVHDISDPTNIVEIGSFDTYPGISTQTQGCWGAFPFFASGVVLATDIDSGLYVLRPQYNPASFLKGYVSNANTIQALSNVSVKILGSEQTATTKLDGTYSDGMALAGLYSVLFDKAGFFPQTHQITLIAGQVVNYNVSLVPIPVFPISFRVKEAFTGTLINDAFIEIRVPQFSYTGQTDGFGELDFNVQYETTYEIQIAKWGYDVYCSTVQLIAGLPVIEIELRKGYSDQFSFDLGWTEFGTATTGRFVRGVPYQTASPFSRILFDVPYDCGNKMYMTGNEPINDANQDDVDNGFTTLVSPLFDATIYSNPWVNFSNVFYSNYLTNPANDTLIVALSNGSENVVIYKRGSTNFAAVSWEFVAKRISDFITPTNTMSIRFTVSDNAPTENVTDASIDFFSLTAQNITSIDESEVLQENEILVYPNPNSGVFNVSGLENKLGEKLVILDLYGKKLTEIEVSNEIQTMNLSFLANGTYIIQLGSQLKKVVIHN